VNAIALDVGSAGSEEHGEDSGIIRSVARALKLLTLINSQYAISLHDLHRMSGLPKPTVFRFLTTLQAEGYVEMEGRQGVYRVGAKVCELSAGYSQATMLVDLCRPILLATTQRIKWPLGLGLLDELDMTVRFSTMPHSPMAVQPSTQGHRYGLLRSAMGAAYLAFCPDEERELLLELAFEEAGEAADPQRVQRRIEAARRRGYALRLPEKAGDSATAALPMLHKGKVIAVLSMTTFGSAMNEALIESLRETLDWVVAEIERNYALRVSEPLEAVTFLRRKPTNSTVLQSTKSLCA
jgi:IclR family mhp operon transcriptional activator